MHVDTTTREKHELEDACWGPFCRQSLRFISAYRRRRDADGASLQSSTRRDDAKPPTVVGVDCSDAASLQSRCSVATKK